MLKLKKFISRIFLYSIALLPLISLFWEQEIGFLKVNWILYPLVLFSLFSTIVIQNRISKLFILFLFITFLYFLKAVFLSISTDSVIRLFVSLVPLFFLDSMAEMQDTSTKRNIVIVYCISISLPIAYGLLQYSGALPYTEFDVVGGAVIGRMSGGYDKPNNFAAFIFPLYLLSIIVFQRHKIAGTLLISFILFLVYLTGLRTVAAIYLVILAAYFFKKKTGQFVYNYYRYYLNFIIGVIFLFAIYFIYERFGFIDALRGRTLTWEAHVSDFLSLKWFSVIFGKGHSNLGDYYSPVWYKGSMVEPHNNTLRMIIIFGFFGFALYCAAMRYFVMKAFKQRSQQFNKFLVSASFIFIMLYSITNEPLFYPSVFWVVLFGVFFSPDATVRLPNGHA
jgi:hypothetical protein